MQLSKIAGSIEQQHKKKRLFALCSFSASSVLRCNCSDWPNIRVLEIKKRRQHWICCCCCCNKKSASKLYHITFISVRSFTPVPFSWRPFRFRYQWIKWELLEIRKRGQQKKLIFSVLLRLSIIVSPAYYVEMQTNNSHEAKKKKRNASDAHRPMK